MKVRVSSDDVLTTQLTPLTQLRHISGGGGSRCCSLREQTPTLESAAVHRKSSQSLLPLSHALLQICRDVRGLLGPSSTSLKGVCQFHRRPRSQQSTPLRSGPSAKPQITLDRSTLSCSSVDSRPSCRDVGAAKRRSRNSSCQRFLPKLHRFCAPRLCDLSLF